MAKKSSTQQTIPYEKDFENFLNANKKSNQYIGYVRNAFNIFINVFNSENHSQRIQQQNYILVFQSIVDHTDRNDFLWKIYSNVKVKGSTTNKTPKTISNYLSGLGKYITFIGEYSINIKTINKTLEKQYSVIKTYLDGIIMRNWDHDMILENFLSRLRTEDRFTSKCWFPIKRILTDARCSIIDAKSSSIKMGKLLEGEAENVFFIGIKDCTTSFIKLRQIASLTIGRNGMVSFTDKVGNTYKLGTKNIDTKTGNYSIVPATGVLELRDLHIDHDPEISLVLSKSIWPRLRILQAEIEDTLTNKLGQTLKNQKPNKNQLNQVTQYWSKNGYPNISGLLKEIEDLHDCMTLTVLVGEDNLLKNGLNLMAKINNSVSPDLKLEQLRGIIEDHKEI